MAKIRPIKETGFLFGEMAMRIPGKGVPSIPSISTPLFETIVALAAEKYDRPLRRLTPRLLRKSVAMSPDVVLADRGAIKIYVDVLVAKIEGRKVTLWLGLGLDAFVPGAVEPLLHFILAYLPNNSALRVEGDAFVGEVLLPEDLYQIPTQGSGVQYFLKSETGAALALIKQNLVDSR